MLRRICALLPLLLVPLADAAAGALSVAPTRVDLTADHRAATVMLQNNADEQVLVEIQTLAWTGSPATQELSATRDLVAMPPVATLAPGAKQLIRIAARGPGRTDLEEAYRLVISEVPSELPGTRAGVRFALRLSLPVFLTPPGATPQPAWSVERASDGGAPWLTVTNQGAAHLQVRRIHFLSADQGQLLQTVEQPAYILPAQRQQWRLPPGIEPPLTLKLDTDLGELAAVVPAAGR